MKSILCAGVLAVLLAGGAVWADHDHAKKDADKSPTTKPVPVNKMCAVQTENPVDDRVTIQYQGKTIGFCCEDCIKDFKANPDKYLDKMK
jgi:YHS domain-containing protein